MAMWCESSTSTTAGSATGSTTSRYRCGTTTTATTTRRTAAVLQTDYLRTARAKRLPAVAVYVRHALPNAVTATITLGGLLLGGMVAGTVLVENVFGWPGLGSTIVSSILSKDYPLVQGVVLVYGAGVLLVNLVVDVILALLDPRSTIRDS